MESMEYCVTGGTGLIGSYLVKALLDEGHKVRATVRDPADETKVSFLFTFHGAQERLKLFKADLMVERSFDEAIDGVDGVFHSASPVLVPYDERIQETLIDPTVKGTINVLRSCAKARSVKRVVLTSSCSTIRYFEDATCASPLNESHWSDLEYCIRNNVWYGYAKTVAEKEAWRLAEELGFDLVAVNPSLVVGPVISPEPTSTLRLILALLRGERDEYPNKTLGFVHIDDVVRSHLLAMQDSRISGRLVCSSNVAHWSQILEMLKTKYPSYANAIPTKCSVVQGENKPHSMDSSKLINLGVPALKTIPEMFHDCIKSFQDKGFLTH
ncbi:Flavonol reductase/cinnamoyl-CoA reductase protein [Dioscorea alata]|uniref:Flavonol reductase/cinnamoyl-CoA reductase protein n=1 Tax=Dioscorea alata TaxID=55571 RepID=A0ACB7UDX6_DIOAL|nr:Flavonol reductase/cinnamoyl-CoA reductase protein [Dioscorea alata]